VRDRHGIDQRLPNKYPTTGVTAVRSFPTMKSDRVLVTFSAFSILSVATALYQHNVSSTYVKAADDLNGDRDVIIKFLYTGNV
jgi:hypothetical protein